MLRSILGYISIAVIGIWLALAPSMAQDAIEEDFMIEDEVIDPAPAPAVEEPAEEMQAVPGPRVKGFTERRPVSCGEFKFWDGTKCADARDKKATTP